MIVIKETHLEDDLVQITLKSKALTVSLLNYGATLTAIQYLEKPQLLTVADPYAYLQERLFINTTTGRITGRIREGQALIAGQPHQLVQNEGPNHLHGGDFGLDNRFYSYQISQSSNQATVTFKTQLPDQLGGFPGNIAVGISYTLFEESDQIRIDYSGIADQPTLFDPSTHLYFRLAKNLSKIWLKLPCQAIGEINPDDNLPTGRLITEGELFQCFNQGAPITDLIRLGQQQLNYSGFNHPFVLKKNQPIIMRQQGVQIKMSGDRDVVIYTGEHFDGHLQTKDDYQINQRAGIAIEMQRFPDAERYPGLGDRSIQANKPYFFSTTLSFNQF